MPTGNYNIFELSSSPTVTVSSSTALLGSVSPFAPSTANILCGAFDGSTGTLVTIPASRTWYGTICASVGISTLPGTGVAQNARAIISVEGAAAAPSTGVLMAVAAQVAGSTGATTIDGTEANNANHLGPLWVTATSTGSVTLTLAKNNASWWTGSAAGILL